MLFRLIILIALGFLAYSLYKKYLKPNTAIRDTTTTAKMVRCDKCGLHLPESEALKHADKNFCCLEHKQAYLNDRLNNDSNSDQD